jgi:hypothetical protein
MKKVSNFTFSSLCFILQPEKMGVASKLKKSFCFTSPWCKMEKSKSQDYKLITLVFEAMYPTPPCSF